MSIQGYPGIWPSLKLVSDKQKYADMIKDVLMSLNSVLKPPQENAWHYPPSSKLLFVILIDPATQSLQLLMHSVFVFEYLIQ